MSNSEMIAITEAREACRGKKKLVERIVAAMRCTKNHWLVTNEDERLRAAILAVVFESNEKDTKTVEDEWEALVVLGNAISGKCSIDNVRTPARVVGIMKLWQEVKGE